MCGGLLDFGGDFEEVNFQAPTGRASDHHRPAAAQLECLEHLVGDANFFNGVGGQGNANRIPNTFRQQHPHADTRFYGPGELRSGLGNPEVKRIINLFGKQAISCNA